MASDLSPILAIRGSFGINFQSCHPVNKDLSNFPTEEGSNCRAPEFSPCGNLIAYNNGKLVKVVDMKTGSVIMELDNPRVTMLAFAPKSPIMVTCENYKGAQAGPNFEIWNLRTKTSLASLYQNKQISWSPQWSDDESIFAILINGQIQIYKDLKFSIPPLKLPVQKITQFALSPGKGPHHIVAYTPGIKGKPSFVRVFKDPFLESNLIVQKAIFKADKVEFLWNKTGTSLLLLTTTDVDNTGASYYGEQGLIYIDTKGESFNLTLKKDGPIHDVKWSPNNREFCVIYGFIPSKATLFNIKGDSVFEFGTGPMNSIYFSPLGDKLILAGFGNLRGHTEVWDMNTKQTIGKWQASDTTYLTWHPSGQYIITATLSPRLRIGNNYKIWHYTGSLLFEDLNFENAELYNVLVQPMDSSLFPISAQMKHVPVPGIQSSQPTASKQAYRPPSARGKPSTFTLRDNDDTPPTTNHESNNQSLSKAAMKNRKKRESKKAKMTEENIEEEPNNTAQHSNSDVSGLTGDPEKDKKIRNITKKLHQISKLKQQKEEGQHLEFTQLEKINKEEVLLKELNDLRI